MRMQKMVLALATGLALRLYFGELVLHLLIVFFPYNLRNARLASSITFSSSQAALSGGTRSCSILC